MKYGFVEYKHSIPEWGEGVKLIYRHYATLYFVFAVDQQESDLGILDLIQGKKLLVGGYTRAASHTPII